ncbi:MAG TPA: Rpn family recombination-promoting nuclease/putative transposase [Spirochaetia bacterium]|nr:Rpn family recombination-promoting nuclease/putative transposase [Spirochaetia bacterium]
MPDQEEKAPHDIHDYGYKDLLSHKKTFLELIRTFVPEEWTKDVDEDELIQVNKSFISPHFTKHEADVVYRTKKGSQDVIFYILLELQSSVDFLMPVRLLGYMMEIWRDILKNTADNEAERKGFRLPAIVPAVLYNGRDNWTAARNFKEVLAAYQDFEKHLLDFRYILCDVNRYTDEDLLMMANLMSCVFFLDKRMTPEEITERTRKAAGIISKLSPVEFKQFVSWYRHVILERLPEEQREQVSRILDEANPWEVEKMVYNLQVALDEMKEKAMTEGEKNGILKGEKQGMLKVARNMLLRDVDVNTICDFTGLSPSEIEELKKDIQH